MFRKRMFAVAVGLGVLGSLGLGAGTAGAQNFEAAAKSFTAAQGAFAHRRYLQAAEGFKTAYEITKDPVLLYNIGESYEKAKQWAKADSYYRRYVADQPRAADRKSVEKRIADLERVHHIEIGRASCRERV